MENANLFNISSDRKIIMKRPKILSQINTKEIQLRNDPKNFLHSGSKSFNFRQKFLTNKKIKKKDIKGQINLLSDLIGNYSYSSIKNLFLIQKLKDENDFLIDELNRNIKKNVLFNKTTKEIFHDLVEKYEKRGYKIPSLTLENNLFKKTPLLIETKNDVEEFYKNDINTQGNYIEDLNDFPEKNWNFLNKLKKEVEFKGDNSMANKEKWDKSPRKNNFYSNKKALSEKKERENLKKEINNIRILIKKQENEKYETEDYYSRNLNKNQILLNRSKIFPINLKDLIKKKLINKDNKKRNIFSLKIFNSESDKKNDLLIKKINKNKKFNKTIKKFYKTKNKYKINGRTLITSLNEKSKNNVIFSYTEQIYHKINKKKLNDFSSVEDEIIQYLKKKNYKINNTNINNFNKDFSERIYDIKEKTKKQGLSVIFQQHLTDFGENGFKTLQKIKDSEYIIEKMDKYLAKHIIDKYFED